MRLVRVAALALLAACAGEQTGVTTLEIPVSLIVAPDTISLDPGQQIRFGAYGRNARNDSVGTSVEWAADRGTITSQGVYTADTVPGEYSISATDIWGRRALARVRLLHRISEIVLVPATATVAAGSALQFMVYGRTFRNDSVEAIAAYTATGGVISARGWYTAGTAPGTFRVIARHATGVADTATVTITPAAEPPAPPPPGPVPVATVDVSPASVTLDLGASITLSATTRDAAGNPLTGRPVNWSSSNNAVATVDGAGTVTATAAGAVTVTATSEGKSGQATVTIAAPAPPPPPADGVECVSPRPEWIWCDDFEQDRLSRYFEYNSQGGSFVRTGGVGFSGSTGMRARWNAGQSEAGSLHLAFGKTPQSYFRPVDAGTANYREIYWRMYVKHQAGWTGGGGDKLSRAMIFASSNWSQAMIAHVWSGQGSPSHNFLRLDPASGTSTSGTLQTTGYNDFGNLRWLGAVSSNTPIYETSRTGQWYCVEAHVKLNTAGSSDGVFQLWIDGVPEASRTGLNWVGSYNTYGINAVYFENFWNAGSTQAQERYFDNIVVSKQRIGCL